jgi:predicted ATPase
MVPPLATDWPRSPGSARRSSDASWAVRRLLEVLAAERPLVVVLEDIHWAEAPMLDLTDAVIERVHGPVLFLCLARPELLEQRSSWAAGKPRALTTTLPPLSPEDARRVAELLLGPQAPAPVVDRVCQTAEGNPLYLEQLTAMLADQGLLVDGRWVGSDDAEVNIPPLCSRSSQRGSIASIPCPA